VVEWIQGQKKLIGISDMEFVLVYKLDNQRVTRLDLQEEFAGSRKKKIKLI
jgi:hypothetical protein